uniref:Uncharacterized protein n=1 Tax=Anopheles maculatus TaxID=74869 RepID=A0A182SZ88_9DIPT
NKPFVNSAIHELEKKLSSATAKLSCQQQSESNYQQQHLHQHHHQQYIASSYPPIHQQYQGQQDLPHYTQHLAQSHYHPLGPTQQFYEEPSHRVPVEEEGKFYITNHANSLTGQQQAPTSSECSGLHAILQVIRAEQQQQQEQQQQEKQQARKEPNVSKHCDLYIATATTTCSPPSRAHPASSTNQPAQQPPGASSQAPKFSAVNFRRVQRHPPVSFPKRPLVTQRSLGSPPSVNVGSSYSPSGSAGSSVAFATASSIANGQQQQ